MSRFNKSLLGLVAFSASSTSSPATNLSNVVVMPQIPDIIRGSSSSASATSVNGPKAADNTKRVLEAKQIIATADVVCFDVDSTVIQEEGIDELAEFCGKGQEVANLTKEAMGGSMTFQEALRCRLDIIKPTQAQIKDFLAKKPSTMSSGVEEFMAYLKSHNKKIYLISGGFHSLIDPVAEQLGIARTNVFANKLLFDFTGNYCTFDVNQPTSRSGGKGEAINQIRNFYSSQLSASTRLKVVMIGDGATDLESSPPADSFIGYGGNIIRESVRERAQYFVTDFQQLM